MAAENGSARGLTGFQRFAAVGCASLVLFVLVFEVGFRLLPIPAFARTELMPTFLADQAGFSAAGHPYQAFVPRPGWHSAPTAPRSVTHNEHGFRGPSVTKDKPPGVYRIVCLGGSSTYGNTPSADEATWPARLQQYLNAAQDDKRVEVLNAGFLGYSTFESHPNLAYRMLDFSPDLVVVYHTINDARCALYKSPIEGDNTHWRSVWPVYAPTPVERVLEKSQTYLITRRYLTNYIERLGDQGVWGIVDYDPQGPDPYTEPPSPVGFASFQRNLVSIVSLARAHGAEVLLATQGCDRADMAAAPSRENQWAAMDRMEEILRAVASERGVGLVEGRAALEGTAASEGRDVVFTNEVHLTDRGCEVLARAFADKILESGAIR